MSINLIPAARRAGMLSKIKENGFAGVDELAEIFQVSVITVRRDLDFLESEGEVERTHGGAIYSHHITKETNYIEKNMQNREIKTAIGRCAASLIKEGETVFVNSGSTTYQIIKSLSTISGIRIVTNNIAAVVDSDINFNSELIIIGGSYRKSSGCTIGNFAESMINQLNVSKTFIGADGISLKSGITSPIAEEAAVTKMMVEHSLGKVIVAADSTKVGRVSTFLSTPLKSVDYLVTDSNFDESFRPVFENAGLKIIIAKIS